MDREAVFKYVPTGPKTSDFESSLWHDAGSISITDYWSGDAAPKGRHATARLLWSDDAMHVLFDAAVDEPLILSESPDLSQKTIGLWDRDVCEIFIAPNAAESNKYFEFEVAPTGEWLDVAIEITPAERLSDWAYLSGMKCSTRIDEDRVLMALEIPWQGLGSVPKAGESWLGNLFRCVGTGPERGYLSWRPTRTERPNFHVPAAFGRLIFDK